MSLNGFFFLPPLCLFSDPRLTQTLSYCSHSHIPSVCNSTQRERFVSNAAVSRRDRISRCNILIYEGRQSAVLLAAFLEAAGTHFTSSRGVGWGGRRTGRGGWRRNAAEDGREGSMIFLGMHTPSRSSLRRRRRLKSEACNAGRHVAHVCARTGAHAQACIQQATCALIHTRP